MRLKTHTKPLFYSLGVSSNFVPGSYLIRYQRVSFLGPGVYSIHKCSIHKNQASFFIRVVVWWFSTFVCIVVIIKSLI